MKKILDTLRSRKGITMTEVIVAMAMVLIVSGAAISLLVASVQFDAKYESQTQALNAAESAVECVRFADEVSELESYLVDKLGFVKQEGVYTFDGETVKVQVVEKTVTVIFDGEEMYEKIFTSN